MLTKDDGFETVTHDVFPAIAGAQRWETTLNVPFEGLTQDTWFVVVVKGTDGISPPMFPIVSSDLAAGSNSTLADLTDGNLGEGGVPTLAYTNPLFVDVDGGGWVPPGVQFIP